MLQIPLKIIADVGFAQFQNSTLCPPPILGQNRLVSKATPGPIRSARCVSAILDEDVQQVVIDGGGGGGSLAEPEHVPDPPHSSLK